MISSFFKPQNLRRSKQRKGKMKGITYMSWNDGFERKKFKDEQKKKAKYYRSLGMTEEQIQVEYDLAHEEFKSMRRNAIHNQPMPESVFDEDTGTDESDNPLLLKYPDAFTVTLEETGTGSRYSWIDQLESPELIEAVKQLSSSQIELLTLTLEGYGQKEIATKLGINQSCVSRQIKKIKTFFPKRA